MFIRSTLTKGGTIRRNTITIGKVCNFGIFPQKTKYQPVKDLLDDLKFGDIDDML
jgi:hypothetical protein